MILLNPLPDGSIGVWFGVVAFPLDRPADMVVDADELPDVVAAAQDGTIEQYAVSWDALALAARAVVC